jgi:diguanylate cyclase (GGDEF)-like protein
MLDDALRTVLEKSASLIFIKNRQDQYIASSDAYAALYGFSSGSDLLGKTDYDLVDMPENADRFAAIDALVMTNGVVLYDVVEPLFSTASDVKWVSTSKYPIRNEEGEIVGLIAEGHVIDNRFDRRTAYEYDLRSVVELSADAYSAIMCDLTDKKVIEFHNPSNWQTDIAVGMSWDDLIAEAKRHIHSMDGSGEEIFSNTEYQKIISLYRRNHRTHSLEYYWDDGAESRWVRNETHLFTNPDTGHLLLAMILHDIGAEHEARAELVKQAHHDSLTGLLNHKETVKRIQKALARRRRGCLFMMDVDDFKNVNDSFGHPVGDEALAAIARVVREDFRAEDIVGRVGGDEFMAYSENLEDVAVAREKGRHILEQIQNLRFSNPDCRIFASVGIAKYNGREEFEQLYSRADAMLYVSKKLGKHRVLTEDDFSGNEEVSG